ncbi:beta-glucanase [Streptomyces polyrhachis]|uniref:Beta-glucanase n=1 Tax=Streptomyces polyrhachis TaxID=1282885 RepID=A0ABW2GNJ0_9ACTN
MSIQTAPPRSPAKPTARRGDVLLRWWWVAVAALCVVGLLTYLMDEEKDPTKGKSVVWGDEFDGPIAWGETWTGDRTSAYAFQDRNPHWFKLDLLRPGAVTVAGGVATFTARPTSYVLENGRTAWETGLLTTEYTPSDFKVRTGDYLEARVRLPREMGAWPALWTWKEGGNEVDSFEFHPAHPHALELTNHVNRAMKQHTDRAAIKPGGWVTVGTYYGAESVEWYVNGHRVLADDTGVGKDWTAYPVLSLSVSDGTHHAAPASQEPITFGAEYVRVYR